ncbi:cyclodeaminase/cyclohydrolase family protein [Methyloparacoccus murrellii]
MIQDTPIRQFLDELASASPTPGGGSVAAIMGALGAALVAMVCQLTLGKKGYESVDAEMAEILPSAEALRGRMLALVAADIEAFDTVMAAYRLPREPDPVARGERIQSALKAATRVPLDCAHACMELIQLCQSVADKGNRNVISDAGVGVMAASAALRSAALNVQVNTGSIRDEAFVAAAQEELNALLRGLEQVESTYETVKARL